MRGAQNHPAQGRQQGRIIPADAGSTAAKQAAALTDKDHPRGCGEHISTFCMTTSLRGSSPRMRGAHLAGICVRNLYRIIPADAGSTLSLLA